jgi:type I restriction enzyme S subunit
LNKVAVPEFEGKCSTEIIPLRPCAELDRRYLSFFLRSSTVVDQISKRTAGARMPRADMDFVLDLRIPLPALDEQRRIVDLLSRAEGIVRLRHEAKAKAAEIIPALFLDMFGDPATNPKGWPVAAIGDLVSYTRYGPRFYDRSYADNGAHILRTTDMGYAGELAWQQSPKLAVSAEELDRYSLRPGTLLVTRTGATIGKTALFRGATQPCIAGAYLIEVGLSERVVPDFVLHLLLGSYGQAQLSRGTRTVAQPNINVPAICAIRLPMPPLEIQQRFERHVRAFDTVLEQQRRAVEAAHGAFDALLSRTFNGHLAAIPLAAEEAAVA